MRILLLSATRAEIAPTLHWLKDHEFQTNGHLVITGQPGIGSLQTAWWLGRHLKEIHPQLVIQAGIAGSFLPNWNPQQVLTVKSEAMADLGVQERDGFKSIFDLSLQHSELPPFQNGLLVNPYQKLLESTKLPQATAITVNQVTTASTDIERLKQSGAEIESMEGAALHFACLQAGLPFIQLRTCSNAVGVRDKSQWQMKEAIESLNNYLMQWIPTINAEIL